MSSIPILVLRLDGLLQSWGEHSKWDFRDSASMAKTAICGKKGKPHVCGDEPGIPNSGETYFHVSPTYVGMNRTWQDGARGCRSKPHVCGDEPHAAFPAGDGSGGEGPAQCGHCFCRRYLNRMLSEKMSFSASFSYFQEIPPGGMYIFGICL